MALRWTSALTMGVPELDAQHRELFARIDRLLDAMLRNDRSEAVRLLAFLRDYVVIHFEAEEGYMADTSYPDAQRHLEEHRRFAATLHALDEEFFEAGTSAGRVLRLEQLVVGWLHDHVYFTDVALGRWLTVHREAARAGGAAEAAPAC